jgi:hypothetical protein
VNNRPKLHRKKQASHQLKSLKAKFPLRKTSPVMLLQQRKLLLNLLDLNSKFVKLDFDVNLCCNTRDCILPQMDLKLL